MKVRGHRESEYLVTHRTAAFKKKKEEKERVRCLALSRQEKGINAQTYSRIAKRTGLWGSKGVKKKINRRAMG